MNFRETSIDGCFVVESEFFDDDRGSFGRSFDAAEFAEFGLNSAVAQCSISRTSRTGTLRGLHFQRAPHSEAKLVRCIRGRVFDVVVDLRPTGPTQLEWWGMELAESVSGALYVPEGCAHGFLTLVDTVELLYQMSAPYEPAAASGIRWDDSLIGVNWPIAPLYMSERDKSWPSLVGDRR